MDDPTAQADCRVAAVIASGKLHKRSAINGIVHLMVEMAEAEMSGRVRTHRSVAPAGCSTEDISEAGFLLASACKNNTAMRTFGYNTATNKIDTYGHSNPDLPPFFQSHRNTTVLKQCSRQSLQHMQVQYTRNWCMIFDETNFNLGSLGQREGPP